MKRTLPILLILLLILFLCVGNAFSHEFNLGTATEITIFDGKAQDADWHRTAEDEEVEPGMQHGQQWDLEGFFLDGNFLYMIGGYDFTDYTATWAPGDIFFDIDGDKYIENVTAGAEVNHTFGYDYAVHFSGTQLELFKAGQSATTYTAHFSDNYLSNPWSMGNGWDSQGLLSFAYYDKDDAATGFHGDTHHVLEFELTSAILGFEYVHYTMQCGNDNMMGKRSVPEPANMILLGTGLLGLVGIGRKKLFKN